jgi:hypothetical protein
MGLKAFIEQNDGEGWMLPEKVRLADYSLGHDDRAKEYQPVRSRLGSRYLDCQLEQSVEESWEECARHAELIDKIIPPPPENKDNAISNNRTNKKTIKKEYSLLDAIEENEEV